MSTEVLLYRVRTVERFRPCASITPRKKKDHQLKIQIQKYEESELVNTCLDDILPS